MFFCPFPGCGRVFSTLWGLKQHFRREHRPWLWRRCPVCGQRKRLTVPRRPFRYGSVIKHIVFREDSAHQAVAYLILRSDGVSNRSLYRSRRDLARRMFSRPRQFAFDPFDGGDV